MYYSGMGLCSGHGNSVVNIRELSLYPQSLLAKLTVHENKNGLGYEADLQQPG